MLRDGPELVALGAFPYSNFIRACRSKGVLIMMQGEGSHTFFVVRQSLGGSASADIPKSDSLVVGPSNYLGLITLAKDGLNSI